MKTIAILSLLISNYAFAICEIVEDPPVSGFECEMQERMPTGSEWTLVKQNPSSLGLNASGGITLAMTVETNASSALIAKVQAAIPVTDKTTVLAEADDSAWIDVVLHRSSLGENTLELVSYRYISGAPTMLSSTTSAVLGSGSTAQYSLSFSYNSGIATLNVLNSSSAVIGTISQTQFGQVVPVFKVRRGVQPSASGVLTSAFTQTSYWSQ